MVPALQERDFTRIYLVAESVAAGRVTRSGPRQENVTRWEGEDPVETDRLSPSVQSLTSPTVLVTLRQTPGSSTSFPPPIISWTWAKSPRRPVYSMLKVRIPHQENNKKIKYFCAGKCRRKINIKRAGTELSQSAEFKSWLESFVVRSPEKFVCAGLDE